MSKHLSACRPYCSKCFYTSNCRGVAKQGQWSAGHRGTCPLGAQQTDVEMGAVGSADLAMMTVCRMCAAATPAERREISKAREGREIERRRREPMDCARCKGALSEKGPRWWVCHGCFAECPSHIHPSWAEK